MKTLVCLLPSIPDGLGQHMQISPERAFWILDFYRRHRTLLHLEGKIFDQEAAALVLITDIDATLQSITVRIFSTETTSWNRQIALRRLRYFFSTEKDHRANGYHSALRLEFVDGTDLSFSERIGPSYAIPTNCIVKRSVSADPVFAC